MARGESFLIGVRWPVESKRGRRPIGGEIRAVKLNRKRMAGDEWRGGFGPEVAQTLDGPSESVTICNTTICNM